MPQNDLLNDPVKEDRDLLNALSANPGADYQTIAETIGASEATVKRHIQKLKVHHIVKRVGSKKTGYWEVRRLPESSRGDIAGLPNAVGKEP